MKTILLITIIIIITIIGCAWEDPYTEYNLNYDNAKESAISAWEMQIGWVSERCLKHLEKTQVIESTAQEISTYCGNYCNGCAIISKNTIVINNRRAIIVRLKVAVHEYIHQIEFCEYPHADWVLNPEIEFSGIDIIHYNKKVWGNQKDSVENLGKEIVQKLSMIQ